MKIALLNLYPVVEASGGAEKVFCDMSNALVAKGHEVCAIASDKREGLPYFHLDDRVTFVNAFPRSLSNKISYLLKKSIFFIGPGAALKIADLKIRRRAREISSAIERFNPDVIVCYQMESTYLVREVLKLKTPLVTMLHGCPKKDYFNRKDSPLYIDALKQSDLIQVLRNEFVNEVFSALNSDDLSLIEVVANSVPFLSQDGKAKYDKRRRIILNVGRLCEQKRQKLLIEAVALIKKEVLEEGWQVHIYGDKSCDSNYTDEINELINKSGLEHVVLLRGTTKEIHSKYREASIFLFPSKSEGWGLALTEAMASGLPAIGCSSCPSVNEIIKDGESGFLCEDSPQDIADKLLILMENEELRERFGKRSIELMREYSPEVVWGKWDKLLRDVVENSKRG